MVRATSIMAEKVVGVCASSHVIVTNCGVAAALPRGCVVAAQRQAGEAQCCGEQV